MKVVLDTNIFISGIHWSGDSERILDAWFEDKFELISSEVIIEELVKTLSNFKIPLSREDILHWASIITGKAVLVDSKTKLNIVKDDPDDDKFLEVGVTGKVDVIISQDKHLLKLKEYQGIKIVNPKEALELI